MIAVTFVIVGMSVLLVACQHSEDRYLKREVAESEVIGLWQMNPSSVEDLRDIGYEGSINSFEHEIQIREDGSCRFRTLVWRRSAWETANAACRWELSSGEHQSIGLDIHLDPPVYMYYYFDEGRLDGRLLMWRHITDPDMWRYIEYAKIGTGVRDDVRN